MLSRFTGTFFRFGQNLYNILIVILQLVNNDSFRKCVTANKHKQSLGLRFQLKVFGLSSLEKNMKI